MPKDILLIGSEERVALYQEAYNKSDLEFRVAKDLNSTMEAIKERLPMLILVDYDILGRKSVEICQTLKKYPGTLHLPLIFLTPRHISNEQNTDLLEVLYIPVNDYIFLPLDPEDFRMRMDAHFQLIEYQEKKKLISVEEKISELKILVERFPNYTAARQELSAIYEKTGQIQQALASNLELAKQYYHQKNFGLAMEVISKMKNMIAKQSIQFSGHSLFLEGLQRCIDILGIKKN